jgi:hypothetical protein
MTNESSSDELSQEKNRSKLRRNKHKDNEEGIEALLQLRHQWPRNIDESRPLRIPGHSITKASVRIPVGYNILQLNQPLIDIDI